MTAPAPQPAAWAYDQVLAGHWAPRIRDALASCVDAGRATRSAAHTGPAALEAARQAVERAADPTAARRIAAVLGDVVADAYAAGVLAAVAELRRAGWRDPRTAPGFERLHADAARHGWRPARHLLAAKAGSRLPAAPAIARLTTGLRSVAAQVLASARQSAARALARAWLQSPAPSAVEQAVHEAVDAPSRAERIAITAVVGAMAAAALDTYQANGAPSWQWTATAGACDDCLAKAAAGPYRYTDPVPPLHPRCRCATKPTAATPSSTAASRGISGTPGLAAAELTPASSGTSTGPPNAASADPEPDDD
jgi:hypothetical protein